MPTPTTWSPTATVPLTGDIYIDSLIGGTKWANPIITYSFPGATANWSRDLISGYGLSTNGREPWSASYAPLTASDQGYFVQALAAWSNVANIQFVEVADTATSVGDIRVAYTYQVGQANNVAWAYMPMNTPLSGDIWINADSPMATTLWSPGSYGYLTVMHEIGHTLGLGHPFEGPNVMPSNYDGVIYTIMSYWAMPGDQSSYFSFNPTTPMVLDIDAIQQIYGANHSFHAGDDVYSFDDSQTYFQTIWDGGGNNAISYTGTQGAYIDLHEGYGSAIGNAVYAYSGTGASTLVNNVWIAHGTEIRSATSGSGNDMLIANDLGNYLSSGAGNDILKGGAGNDTLRGGAGNDVIDGGGGHDVAAYSGALRQFTISKTADGYQVKDNTGAEGTDAVSNVQEFAFSDLLIDLDVVTAAANVSASTLKSVVELYVAFFNRVPDSEGMTYWLQQAASGMPITTIANSFYSAAIQYSTLTHYSPDMTNADFVTIVYKNVLGRDTVDAGGMEYWTKALADGTETRGTLVESILNSAHTFKGNATYGWVADLLDNKYAVGKLFAIDLALSYETPQDSITKGMQIAAAVTSTDTSAAVSLIGVQSANIHL